MDNNNLQPQPQQILQPTPSSTPMVPPPGPAESNKKIIIWLILGLLVIILAVGGIYLYLSSLQKSETTTSQRTPTPVAEENLENDLNAIEVGDLEQEFVSVDQDLQNL